MKPIELPQSIRFGRETCGRLDEAERREWWIGNGLVAYAAGTLAHTLTRRYYGLLVAPVEPPLGCRRVLAKADATLMDGDHEYPLFSNRWYSGAMSPAGHVHMESFHLDGRLPVWRFAIGETANAPSLAHGPRLDPIGETANAPSLAHGPRLDPIGETANAPSLAHGPRLDPIGDIVIEQRIWNEPGRSFPGQCACPPLSKTPLP
jgi:hypothetical protein